MIDYSFGHYGFLPQGSLKNPPLGLQDFGIERRCREPYHYENAVRTSYCGYLLQYTLKGCGIYETKGNPSAVYKLPPGHGFFLHLPENSRYYLPTTELLGDSSSPEWEFFYLHFDGPAAAPFFEAVRNLSGPVFSLSPTCPPIRLFLTFFDQCSRQKSRELYEDGEFLYSFLTQLLRELETPSAGGSPLVRQACSYAKEHFSTIRGVEDIAQFCGVSQEHLTRVFHRETGQTPLKYLTRLRIEHSLFLLLNTREQIDRIAIACGFLNGNYFAKVFGRYLNCSPEEYRKRNRN